MTTLYRLYDHDARLLYIGIAEKWATRMGQHAADKTWWPDVANVRFEQLPDRTEALTAEREAISTERPLHNIVHNTGTERTPQSRLRPTVGLPLRTDQCVALGMTDRRCPIGVVQTADDKWIELSLYSFWQEQFTTVKSYRLDDVAEIQWATWRWSKEDTWGRPTKHETLEFDTNTLADFQTRWMSQ
jgi:predicted GIY-YIG superfamily endonuclease